MFSQLSSEYVGLLAVFASQIMFHLAIFLYSNHKPVKQNMKNTNIIVSVEGNIGSGKSTLLDRLKLSLFKNKKFVFIQEPVDMWEKIKDETGKSMVQLFYEDQDKYSFMFQIMAYTSRIKVLKKALQENQNAIIICERSLFTDKMVFANMLRSSNKISHVGYQIYNEMFEDFASDFPLHKIIYVNASPDTCLKRVNMRSRAGENTISLDYLSSCHDYHNSMMNNLPMEKLVLDGNQDILKHEHVLNDWLQSIQQFVEA